MSTPMYTYHTHIIQQQADAETAFLQQFAAASYPFEQPLVILNPYLITPLTALIMFRLPEAQTVHIRIHGLASAGDVHFDFPAAREHFLPVYGLYAGHRNQVTLTLDDGTSQSITITTPAAPAAISRPDYVKTTADYFRENVMFVSPSSFGKMVAFDYAGDLRWYTTLDVVFDIKRAANGRIWIATERLITLPYVVTGLYEMSMLGKIYHEYRLPGGTHHDYAEDGDGNIIILTQDPNRDTVEDVCAVLDRQTGQILRTIDLKALLPASAAAGNRATDRDWLHNNAVWYDHATESLSFSGRNLDAIINIDYASGSINWILGDPDKWPQDYVARYFFTPAADDADFEWFYAQHACMILPDGDVFLLDNGAWRSKSAEKDIPAASKYTRGVRYRLDHTNRTVRQIWQYGKERGSAFFSPHISNVDYYGDDHYMIHSGDIGQLAGVPCEKPPIFYLGKPAEKDLTYYAITTEIRAGQVVYEMKISSNAYYRAKKMPLYHPNDRPAFGPGTQLGSLGVSPTIRLKLPKMAPLPLPLHYQARLDEEIDRFRFSLLLENGAYACLILQNDQEQHAYHIPTTEKDALAMCVGTFLPQNAQETFITISKEGLRGEYRLYLLIEEQLYALDILLTINPIAQKSHQR